MVNNPTLITVLRHGEVEGASHVFRGKSDPPLSAAGWQQMREALRVIGASSFNTIASSPLVRCRAFAQSVAAELDLALDILPDFQEMNFGDWEEQTPQAAQMLAPELFERFQSNPQGLSPPNGEPFDAFRKRVTDAFAAWLEGANGGHRLLIAHAGVMRIMLAEQLGLPLGNLYRIALPPAASFQLSLLASHPPCLLNLNIGQPCAA